MASAPESIRSVPGPADGSGTIQMPQTPADTPVATDAIDKNVVPAADGHVHTAHLARFEFSDQGTKVLMVEWYPSITIAAASTAGAESGTTNSGKPQVDADAALTPPPSGISKKEDNGASLDATVTTVTATSHKQRKSSLVPAETALERDLAEWEVSWPGKSMHIPARDTDENGSRRRVFFMLPSDVPVPATITISRAGHPSLILKPLPAIFPERFEAESGSRGVLHTIWAKKRLIELDREVEAEMRNNAESVGLEMALVEKNWILDNFLQAPRTPTPVSARVPAIGKLGDKLKGLRLATSPADLVPTPTANTFTNFDSTLSPLRGDIAVSSFSAISTSHHQPAAPMSLDAALSSESTPKNPEIHDTEEELFALPMSPRSPDMKRSPFSALEVSL